VHGERENVSEQRSSACTNICIIHTIYIYICVCACLYVYLYAFVHVHLQVRDREQMSVLETEKLRSMVRRAIFGCVRV